MVADKFQWVFSETLLNTCGKDTKFCRRQRTIRVSLGPRADGDLCKPSRETWRIHRGFNALFDIPMTYKRSIINWRAHVATFMGTMASRLLGELTLKVLGSPKDEPCGVSPHRDQDGVLAIRRLARGVSRALQNGQARGGHSYHHGSAVRCPSTVV